jgi:putative addiction module component (TIGR02574 family)
VTGDAKELLTKALLLPDHDRAELVRMLLESLWGAERTDENIDDAWLAEIERRAAAVDAGDVVTSDWDELRRRIER